MKTTRVAAVLGSEQEKDGSFFLSLYLCMRVSICLSISLHFKCAHLQSVYSESSV